MNSDVLVRVINKNADGALVRSLDGTIEARFEWETFNKYFTLTENANTYKLKIDDEIQKEADKINTRMDWLKHHFPRLLMITVKQERNITPELVELSYVGQVLQEYTEKFSVTQAVFIRDFHFMRNSLTRSLERMK